MLNAFRAGGRRKGTSIIVWALLGLLIVGLTGFGLGGAVSGLATQNVATIGGQKVPRDEFVRRLFGQIDAFSRQTGQRLTVQQARLFGLDGQVLSQLVSEAAIDDQAEAMKISAGDELVRDILVQSPAMQGLTGGFDPLAYESFLNRNGYSASEYEDILRRQIARSIMETGVAGGVEMPGILAETVMAYEGEQRGYRYVRLTAADLEAPPALPGAADLRAFYDDNPDAYTTPETRQVSYAALLPDAAAAASGVTEEEVRAAYDARVEDYTVPERRMVDVIAFGTEEEAAEVKAGLDAGTLTFDQVAADRGLNADDLSLGAITADTLDSYAGDEIFAAAGPGILGPYDTDLGPALYRLNAILAAQSTSFEEAREELRAELSSIRALDQIAAEIEPIQDLLAAGATLEEIADETPLVLGTMGLTSTLGEGLAGDVDFRKEAFEAEPGEERDLIELGAGGIVALRVDEITAPALRPYDEVRDAVASDWRVVEEGRLLAERAAAMQAALEEGRILASLADEAGLELVSAAPAERGAELEPGLPPDLPETVFGLEAGGSAVIEDVSGVYLVQLAEVVPFDASTEEAAERLAQINEALSGQAARSLFQGYIQMLINAEGVSVNESLIDTTLSQYP